MKVEELLGKIKGDKGAKGDTGPKGATGKGVESFRYDEYTGNLYVKFAGESEKLVGKLK